MTKDEALDVLQTIATLFSNFNLTVEKARIFAPILMKMDFQLVMKNVEEHAISNPFPPTIADIAAFPPPKNDYLEKMQQWEKEAALVTPEQKEKLRKMLNKLLKEKSNGYC